MKALLDGMYQSNSQFQPSRYSTSRENALANNIYMNDFYKREIGGPPVFLTVDTTLKSLDWVKCFYTLPVQIDVRGVLQVGLALKLCSRFSAPTPSFAPYPCR